MKSDAQFIFFVVRLAPLALKKNKHSLSVSCLISFVSISCNDIQLMKTSPNSPNEDHEMGNTIPSRAQISTAKRWCFTLHDYNIDDINNINTVSTNSTNFYMFSEELGHGRSTPHLQGYIEFKTRVRPKNLFENNTIHWEKSKGNKQQNMDYIKKEGGTIYINGLIEKKIKTISILYPWQESLKNKLLTNDNDRIIYWYHEGIGNTGKSAFTKYMCYHHKAIILSGKGADMKYGVIKYKETNNIAPHIIIIDIPRSMDLQFFSYTATEEIKNGCFFSNKYESNMFIMNSPNIVIFSNEIPDKEKFSKDRWIIHHI